MIDLFITFLVETGTFYAEVGTILVDKVKATDSIITFLVEVGTLYDDIYLANKDQRLADKDLTYIEGVHYKMKNKKTVVKCL